MGFFYTVYWLLYRALLLAAQVGWGWGLHAGFLHSVEGDSQKAFFQVGAILEAVIARPSIRSKQQAKFDRFRLRSGGNYYGLPRSQRSVACNCARAGKTGDVTGFIKQRAVPEFLRCARPPQQPAPFTPQICKSFRVFVAGGARGHGQAGHASAPGAPDLLLRRLGLSAKRAAIIGLRLLFNMPSPPSSSTTALPSEHFL